eukprot:TRINITY_DN7890_c0_g1_i1.p1 TRINITY_DN7890_c0_g1~~TRINITY_DN7890_c0_g1_i1.p1  ORF type:complete len:979 (+),score=151.05 TRINITY_DN7890_c0_g1_i1:50-2986(+)
MTASPNRIAGEFKEDASQLSKKAKDRLQKLESACKEAEDGLAKYTAEDKGEFPVQAVVFMYVLAVDCMDNKEWGLKKGTQVALMAVCVNGIVRLAKEGFFVDPPKLDRVPGAATGVGKTVLEAVVEVLTLKCPGKHPDTQCLITRGLETLVTLPHQHHKESSMLFQAVAQMMFRLSVCSPSLDVRKTSKSSLQTCLLHSVAIVEDIAAGRQRTRQAVVSAGIAVACFSASFKSKPNKHRHTFSSVSLASSCDDNHTVPAVQTQPLRFTVEPMLPIQKLSEDEILSKMDGFELDVYRIVRALSNISMDDITTEEDVDATKVRSRIYAGELLCFVLSHAVEGFASATLLVSSLKSYVFKSLLENLGHVRPSLLFSNSTGVMQVILHKFSRLMRVEISQVLVGYLLPLAKSASSSFSQKIRVIELLESFITHPTKLITMFVNHDCSPYCEDVTAEIFTTLSYMATHVYTYEGWVTMHQNSVVQHRASEVLCSFVASLAGKVKNLHDSGAGSHRQSLFNKKVMREVLNAYKKSWKTGTQILQKYGVLPDESPATVAKFVFDNALRLRLDPAQTGELLLKNRTWNFSVLHEYMSLFKMSTVPIDEALRTVLSQFLPLGESQVIDRLLYVFVCHYAKQNDHIPMINPSGPFSTGDDILLQELDDNGYPMRAVVSKACDGSCDEIEATVYRFKEKDSGEDGGDSQPTTIVVQREDIRKLNFIYFAVYTLLIINTQYNKNIKAEDMRKQDDITELLVIESNGTMSRAACEEIVKGVYLAEMKLSPAYHQHNHYELSTDAHDAWLTYRTKLPGGASTATEQSRTDLNHHKQLWVSKQAELEVPPAPFFDSELPVKKAAAKAYEKGAASLRKNLNSSSNQGLQCAYEDGKWTREDGALLFEHLWPYCKVAFDRALICNTNMYLVRKVREATVLASELAGFLNLRMEDSHTKAALVAEHHSRLAEYLRTPLTGPSKEHPVGALALLVDF